MNRRTMVIACLLAASVGASPAAALGPFVTAVRTYDENLIQFNQVDVSATPLGVATMAANVATAYDAGFGGVIDFDNGTFTDAQTIDAVYAGGTKSLRLTNAARTWSIGSLGTGSGGAISGGNVAFNGAPSPFPTPFLNDIVFGNVTDPGTGVPKNERVTSFGFTIIDGTFNGSGNTVHIDTYFSNGTAATLDWTIPLGFNNADTFFGWTAPSGAYITHVAFTATNNTATEDWAFITTVVPEPTTASSAAVMGLFGVRFLRRGKRAP